MVLIFCLIFQVSFSFIKLKENIDFNDFEIKKDTSLVVLDNKIEEWYELYEAKKNIGFVSSACVEHKNSKIILKKACAIYSMPDSTSSIKSLNNEDKFFSIYLIKNIPLIYVAYKDKKFWINSNKVYIDPSNQENLIKVPIEKIVKMNKDKIYTSNSFDRTMYFSSKQGLFISYNGKDWYYNKSLAKKKYEIAIADNGWVIVDNLYSKDYGINFSEIFPQYAFPFKNTYVRSIIASPQAKKDLYLTFSSGDDHNLMALYILNIEKLDEGWKRVYPNIDGKLNIVKVDDSFKSIVNFLSNYIAKKNKTYEIQDININQKDTNWLTNVLVYSKKDKFIVNFILKYNLELAWQIEKETWNKI